MRYVKTYIALLREAYEDIEDAVENGITGGFVMASLVMIPFFGSLFFLVVLVNA